ncbi:MAG: CPBP family intramembrane metalloprotease [Planctomycetes bacterium]|nr:CPBP family intramembrane metalloprotease [Planctomycetota bacterium]
MTKAATPPPASRLDRHLRLYPEHALIAPLFAYLILLALLSFREPIGEQWVWVLNLIRGVGGMFVVWIVRKHLPAWGKPHVLLAFLAGVACAALWVVVHKVALSAGITHPFWPVLFGKAKPPEEINPFGMGLPTWVVWANIVTRIGVATTTVAVVEELFWRAFLLRVLIDWERFHEVPIGKFTWRSFLVSSAVSIMEHPQHWVTSITCWFAFNGLMYWKRSILFLVLVHGFTNLVLYIYVVAYRDWIFW